MGILLGTLTFTSSFIKNASLKDAQHVDLFLQMGDVQMAFGIITCCFMQHPSCLLWCTPPSFTFIESFFYYYSFFLQMFKCLLGPRSFDSLKGPLICKPSSVPITFGGVMFILTSPIASTTYQKSWALITSVIVVRFIINQHPFFLKVLTQVNNNTSRQHVIFYHC